MSKKRSDQMKLLDIILARNPKCTVGQAAIIYNSLKALGDGRTKKEDR